jgi:hypothetical protein
VTLEAARPASACDCGSNDPMTYRCAKCRRWHCYLCHDRGDGWCAQCIEAKAK